MPIYAKVDKNTGDFHNDCGSCGLLSISGDSLNDPEVMVFKNTNADDNHVLVEISSAERDKMKETIITVERDGNRIEVPVDSNILDELERKSRIIRTKNKIDLNKATTDMRDRAKVNDTLEIDGPGGKEIIVIGEEPESIIIAAETTEQEPPNVIEEIQK